MERTEKGQRAVKRLTSDTASDGEALGRTGEIEEEGEEEWFIFVGEAKRRLMLTDGDGGDFSSVSLESSGRTEIDVTSGKEKKARCFVVARRRQKIVEVFLIKNDVSAPSDSVQDREQIETFVNLCAQSAFVNICLDLKKK